MFMLLAGAERFGALLQLAPHAACTVMHIKSKWHVWTYLAVTCSARIR